MARERMTGPEPDYQGKNIESGQTSPMIDQLGGVFDVSGRWDTRLIFVGWGAMTDSPVITNLESSLGETAQASLEVFRRSGREFRKLSMPRLIVCQYATVSYAIDNPDFTNGDHSVDLVRIDITDTDRNERSLTLDEDILLDSIADAIEQPWYDTVFPTTTSGVAASRTMYSVVAPGSNQDNVQRNTAWVILFPPHDSELSNELRFQSFIKGVFQRLVSIDLKQPQDMRKGYLDAVLPYMKMDKKPDFVRWLQQNGLLKTDADTTIKAKKFVGRGLQFLRDNGLITMTQKEIDRYNQSVSESESLDLQAIISKIPQEQLFQLVFDMRDAAHQALRR